MTENKGSNTADREIVTSRVFDARELVWKAWTDAEHVGQWWGPRGFTTTTHSRELKPGGVWRFVMHGPDGTDYENLVTYLEITPPERLVYKHGGAKDTEPVNFTQTITFEKEGKKGEQTRLTMRAVFPSANAREFVVKTYNAVEGGKQHLARLAEYLETTTPAAGSGGNSGGSKGGASGGKAGASRPFVLTRAIDAPRELVWKAWTERDELIKWFGPKGMPITRCTMDLRVGGMFHYAMRMPDGKEMWGRWVIRELVPRERMVVIVSFSDEKAGVARNPFGGEWPLETHSVMTLADHAGKSHGTVITLEWSAYNATAAEQKAFDAGHESMKQGWGGTFEQLVEYLAKK